MLGVKGNNIAFRCDKDSGCKDGADESEAHAGRIVKAKSAWKVLEPIRVQVIKKVISVHSRLRVKPANSRYH